MTQTMFPCGQCGAHLEFQPGANAQKCPYCGHENPIEFEYAPAKELDYEAFLRGAMVREEILETITVKCVSCGAESSKQQNVTSGQCPFCGANIVATGSSRKTLKPKSLLPFHVTPQQARDLFKKWIRSLWFAPNALKKLARQDSPINGMYTPYWTYDCFVTTHYEGQRGDDYWTTETYTTTVNGRRQTRTRQVRKTRWRSVSGTVQNTFDDVLVVASQSLPREYAEKLEPWDLQNLVPYKDDFLSGFRAESYQVDLPEGFTRAKEIMEPTIHATICRDIGGDHQRVSSTQSRYDNITFKHVLLPVWISAYRYRDKVFRFLVNARTGEVQGERPWSWIKITLAIIVATPIVVGIIYALAHLEGG
jgi:DNA-directed RNA polymerase subunit RPC12/RpoP